MVQNLEKPDPVCPHLTLLVLESLKAPFFGPKLFLLYINDLPDNVICNVAIYTDDTTLYSKSDQASGFWQQLELASELESDLRDIVNWGVGSGLML